MACEERYDYLISLRAAGALESSEAAALDRHVAECADCAEELKAALEDMQLFRAIDAPLPDRARWEKFDRKFWEKADGQKRAVPVSRRKFSTRRIACAVAAAAVIVLAVAALWQALSGKVPAKAGNEMTQTARAVPAPGEVRKAPSSPAQPDRENRRAERMKTIRAAAGKGYLNTCLAAMAAQKDAIVYAVTESWLPSAGKDGDE
jgi:anti-sigma factor RsiW